MGVLNKGVEPPKRDRSWRYGGEMLLYIYSSSLKQRIKVAHGVQDGDIPPPQRDEIPQRGAEGGGAMWGRGLGRGDLRR